MHNLPLSISIHLYFLFFVLILYRCLLLEFNHFDQIFIILTKIVIFNQMFLNYLLFNFLIKQEIILYLIDYNINLKKI